MEWMPIIVSKEPLSPHPQELLVSGRTPGCKTIDQYYDNNRAL
jgi:hypothetical protein